MSRDAKRWINRLCGLLLSTGTLALLVFTPLAFGAVHVWAFSLMEMAIFFLLMLWMGQMLLGHGNTQTRRLAQNSRHVVYSPFRRITSPILPLALFLGLILFQLIPLPPGLLQVLSPSTYRLYQTALPGWPHQEPLADLVEVKVQRLAPVTGPSSASPTRKEIITQSDSVFSPQSSSLSVPHVSPWRPLSLYPQTGRIELLKLLAYLAFFALVAWGNFLFLSGERARRGAAPQNFPLPSGERVRVRGTPPILLVLIMLGTGLALLAFLQQATWNGKLLWFFVPYHWGSPRPGIEGRLHGPFVNPDHLAGYLAMTLPLAVAAVLVYGRWERVRMRGERARLYKRITQIVDALSSLRALSCGLFTLAAIAILTALVFTLSRGGFSAAFASLFFMAWLLWPQSKGKEGQRRSHLTQSSVLSSYNPLLMRLGRALCFLGFLSVPVFYLEYPQVFGRFLHTPQEMDTGRPVVYAATLALWRDFPLLGVGLGNFQEVFPRYQPPAAGQAFYDYTHNDYLQLLAETGLLGLTLLVCCVAGVLQRVVRSWPQVAGERRLWLAGVLTGIVAILLHSLVDFNLHIPSNALLFVTLLALSVRLGWEPGTDLWQVADNGREK